MAQASKNEEPGEAEENVDYEDDFEKDLDWLINEDKDNNQDTESQDEDIDAKIDKELQEDENHELLKVNQQHDPNPLTEENLSTEVISDSGTFLNPLNSESHSSSEAALQDTQPDDLPLPDGDFSDQDEEAKRYIAEKIEMANRLLEHEKPVDDKRERKLKFKDNLIDLEVPPLEFDENDREYSYREDDSLSKMSDLNIHDELKEENSSLLQNDSNDENKDGKILVEKDGKFELMSLRDIESQSFLPKIDGGTSVNEAPIISPNSLHGNALGSPTPKKEENLMLMHSSTLTPPVEVVSYLPQPPPNPRGRPTSANHAIKGRRKSPRRVQSADMPQRNSTFSLSPQQKERKEKIEKMKNEQRKEMEARKREEEEQKRKENETAFRAWLHKKKEQLFEEKRIQEAKEMEEMNNRNGERDPDGAYEVWLRKKQTEQLREKQMEELKRQEEEADSMHGKEECEQAFKQWLRRKRLQKRAEQQAAKELSRKMVMEARRARQIQNLLYSISDTKSLRLKDHFI
ncbi:coiled-coil domain-containing protein 181 isoform X2 [Lissotriton helveticus]